MTITIILNIEYGPKNIGNTPLYVPKWYLGANRYPYIVILNLKSKSLLYIFWISDPCMSLTLKTGHQTSPNQLAQKSKNSDYYVKWTHK